MFASEIKALLANSAVTTEPNIEYCLQYVKRGALDHTRETAFKNIYRFNPASYLEIAVGGIEKKTFKEKTFWRFAPNLSCEKYDPDKATQLAHQYYQLLSDAVKIRLRADVRIGAALSGGLDSSTVVYMINEQLRQEGVQEKQETFSSVYKDDGVQYCDESAFIDTLASFLHVNSHQIEPTVHDVPAQHRKMVYAMDNPPGGSNMGGWYTFKCVANANIKINLDGQGADEQLAGYFKYIWNYCIHVPVRDFAKEYKALFTLPGLPKKKLAACMCVNLFLKLCPFLCAASIMHVLPEKIRRVLQPVNQRLYDDTMGYLVTLIHYGDSQSMAHSVESRLPYMDYRLVEFLASIPTAYKLHNGWTKRLSRVAMCGKLPDAITWRKDKMGWPDPMEYWFRGPLQEWLCTSVEKSAFLTALGLNKNIRVRLAGREPIEKCVRLLNLSVWHSVFF